MTQICIIESLEVTDNISAELSKANDFIPDVDATPQGQQDLQHARQY